MSLCIGNAGRVTRLMSRYASHERDSESRRFALIDKHRRYAGGRDDREGAALRSPLAVSRANGAWAALRLSSA